MTLLAGPTMRRVTVFGGSFNPPHRGHEELIATLFAHDLSDEVEVVPVFEHPFGKSLAPFADRLAMCHLAFARFGTSVRISDIEARLGGRSYTVRTLETIRAEHPDADLQLVVGADTLKDTSSWRDFPRVRSLARLLVVPRAGETTAEALDVAPPPDISSSDIRLRLAHGDSVSGLLSEEVANYALSRGLYRSGNNGNHPGHDNGSNAAKPTEG